MYRVLLFLHAAYPSVPRTVARSASANDEQPGGRESGAACAPKGTKSTVGISGFAADGDSYSQDVADLSMRQRLLSRPQTASWQNARNLSTVQRQQTATNAASDAQLC